VGDVRNSYKILVRKPEGKIPLRQHRHKWEDNVRIDLREIGWKVVDWIHLAHDRNQWQALANMVMNLQVPQKEGNVLTNRVTLSFSRMTLFYGIGWLVG
jgi:hypothetical protein